MIPDDPPAGVPDWIVTYGDMMSLLLTFFIMLVSLSELKGDSKYQAIMEAIMKHLGFTANARTPPGKNFPMNSLVAKLKTLGAKSDSKRGTGGVRNPGLEGDDVRVFRKKDGTLISAGESLIFAPGTATLVPESEQLLKTMASTLAGKPNKIDVRGHVGTAPLPEESTFKSKFELGYERARQVRDQLVKLGVQSKRVRISSAGDNEPVPETTHPDRSSRDRVEIFVLDTFAAEFIGPRVEPGRAP